MGAPPAGIPSARKKIEARRRRAGSGILGACTNRSSLALRATATCAPPSERVLSARRSSPRGWNDRRLPRPSAAWGARRSSWSARRSPRARARARWSLNTPPAEWAEDRAALHRAALRRARSLTAEPTTTADRTTTAATSTSTARPLRWTPVPRRMVGLEGCTARLPPTTEGAPSLFTARLLRRRSAYLPLILHSTLHAALSMVHWSEHLFLSLRHFSVQSA